MDRYFVVFYGDPRAKHITMLHVKNMDFFAIGTFLDAMVLAEPLFNWKNPSRRSEQGSHLAA